MIRYTLQCGAGHGFESWFPSSASYEEQRERGFVTCPHCGSAEVEKAIMAPAVARTDQAPRPAEAAEPEAPPSSGAGAANVPASPAGEAPDAPSGVPADARPDVRPDVRPLAMVSQPEQELRALMRQIREHVEKTSDYVGADFSKLARQMHEGEIEHRSIYGEATTEEVKALREDEVEIFPLPVLPDERN